MIKNIYQDSYNQKCYFRTSVKEPYSKVLIQVTDRCNMNCKHCFVKANNKGHDINLENFDNRIMEHLKKWKTTRVTITGGEPLLNDDILYFLNTLNRNDISVGICTNGMLIDKSLIHELSSLSNIHFNISLDGFSEDSYSKFRGIKNQFMKIKNNIKLVANSKLLKGILVTPNRYSTIDEYVNLCKFALENNASYVLFNPIAQLGRGDDNYEKCSVSDDFLYELYNKTRGLQNDEFSINYIRFPNLESDYSGECIYNRLYYIYADGSVTKCPYVSFSINSHEIENMELIFDNVIGNVYNEDVSVYERDLSEFDREDCIAHLVQLKEID